MLITFLGQLIFNTETLYTPMPGSSGGKLTFGPTIVQKGNSYQIQADTEKASLNEVSINE